MVCIAHYFMYTCKYSRHNVFLVECSYKIFLSEVYLDWSNMAEVIASEFIFKTVNKIFGSKIGETKCYMHKYQQFVLILGCYLYLCFSSKAL